MADIPICTKTFKLNNGQDFPAVGLGTWQGSYGTDDTAALEASVVFALQNGYRLIDTAQFYGVEAVVGEAIRKSGVARSEITLVTKFWGEWHGNPAGALEVSLRELGVEYIDLFLMHWPWATLAAPERRPLAITQSPTFVETWKLMEPLIGPRCRAIGVSNFSQKTLDVLLASATIVPAVNQIELHALNPNHKLAPYCQAKGIHVMSWSTLGGPGNDNAILKHDLFKGIAANHGCSTGCVSLSWAVQRGFTVIPKSRTPSRILENIKLVTLTDAEMSTMNNAYQAIGKLRLAKVVDRFMYVEEDGKRKLAGWNHVDLGWEDEEGNWLV